MRDKYSQKLDHAKQSATDALKTVSKRVIQKTVEASGDFIGNKIADRITKVSKTSKRIKLELEISIKELQISMMKKYVKKDTYIQKKYKKTLMIWD